MKPSYELDVVRRALLKALDRVPVLFGGALREIAARTLGYMPDERLGAEEYRRRKRRAYNIGQKSLAPLLSSGRILQYRREGAIFTNRQIYQPPLVSWKPGGDLPDHIAVLDSISTLFARNRSRSELLQGYYLTTSEFRPELNKELYSKILAIGDSYQPPDGQGDVSVDRRTGAVPILAYRVANLYASLVTYSPDAIETFRLTEQRLISEPTIAPEAFIDRGEDRWALYLGVEWRPQELLDLFVRHQESGQPFEIYLV